MLLHLEYLNQELNDSAANYKAAVTHSNKHLLLLVYTPINIISRHLQDHQTHSSTSLNLNPDLKAEATLKTHRFKKAKNHMNGAVTPQNPGGYHTTKYSSDVRITYKMNMQPAIFPPTPICLMVKSVFLAFDSS